MGEHYNPSVGEHHNPSVGKSSIPTATCTVLADNTPSVGEHHNPSVGKSSIPTATHTVLADNTPAMGNPTSKPTATIVAGYIHNSLSWRRPNTNPLFTAYTPLPFRDRPKSTLLPHRWEELLKDYPDAAFRDTIVGIAIHGARIGYEGPPLNLSSDNHSSAMKISDELSKT